MSKKKRGILGQGSVNVQCFPLTCEILAKPENTPQWQTRYLNSRTVFACPLTYKSCPNIEVMIALNKPGNGADILTPSLCLGYKNKLVDEGVHRGAPQEFFHELT